MQTRVGIISRRDLSTSFISRMEGSSRDSCCGLGWVGEGGWGRERMTVEKGGDMGEDGFLLFVLGYHGWVLSEGCDGGGWWVLLGLFIFFEKYKKKILTFLSTCKSTSLKMELTFATSAFNKFTNGLAKGEDNL